MPFSPLFLSSALLGGISFVFVAQQLAFFSFLHWFPDNTVFYLLIPAAGLAVLWSLYRVTEKGAWLSRLRLALAALAPAVLCFALGTSVSREFHYTVFLSVGLYLIATFAYWASRFIRDDLAAKPTVSPAAQPSDIMAPLDLRQRANRLPLFGVLALTLVFFAFGLHHLTRFAAVDEPLWLDGRIGKFWKNLAEEKMDKTLVSDKPGITVVLATGPALLVVEPSHYRDTRAEFQAKDPALNIERYYLAFRFPFLAAITVFLPLFYVLLVPLIGRLPALLGYAAISLSPVLIGMSKIVNPDGLLWVFAPLALLAFLVFLERSAWRFLILSGILLGLSLLTKYVANILIVFCFGLLFVYPLWQGRAATELRRLVIAFLIWLGIGLSVLYLFIPDFWVGPGQILESTFLSQAFEKVSWLFALVIGAVLADQAWFESRLSRRVFELLDRLCRFGARLVIGLAIGLIGWVALNGALGMPWINFMETLASPKNSYEFFGPLVIFLTHFYPLVFGIAPLILLGVFAAGYSSWPRRTRSFDPSARLILAIFLFVLLYYLGSSINDVSLINRYQIMLYPLLSIIGGLGLAHLLTASVASLRKRYSATFSPTTLISIGFGLIIACLAISPATTPFPLSYASVLLPKQFTVDVKDMGAGSYEVAQYLNQLPGAETLTIWTDKSGVCKFFVGRCLDGLTFEKLKQYRIDYVVLSSGRAARTARMFDSNRHLLNDDGLIRFDAFYERSDPAYMLAINGRPGQYVKVFPLEP